jgi:hypothetical protein
MAWRDTLTADPATTAVIFRVPSRQIQQQQQWFSGSPHGRSSNNSSDVPGPLTADPATNGSDIPALTSRDLGTTTDSCKLEEGGHIVKLLNWRGITLLSIPSKVLCRVMLDRLKDAFEKDAFDKKLSPEQVGIWQGKSYTDHIATLRIIIEQLIQRMAISFVFNLCGLWECLWQRVQRNNLEADESLWEFLRKFIRIIQQLYEDSTCQVIHRWTSPFVQWRWAWNKATCYHQQSP